MQKLLNDGATPEPEKVEVMECPGANEGISYAHKFIWTTDGKRSICQRCGGFKDVGKDLVYYE